MIDFRKMTTQKAFRNAAQMHCALLYVPTLGKVIIFVACERFPHILQLHAPLSITVLSHSLPSSYVRKTEYHYMIARVSAASVSPVFALLLYASAKHNIFAFIYVKLKIKTTCRYEFSVGMQACAPVMICNVAQAVM